MCQSAKRLTKEGPQKLILKNRKLAWESKGQVEEAGLGTEDPNPLPLTLDKT
jgi:hypothetical protein